MELPRNTTQIGETDDHCRVYVEDYVISYMKQLSQAALLKPLALGLYGVQKEEDGILYFFFYGAAKLDFLQRSTRQLSQIQLQEAERLRACFFEEYRFLAYCLLDGELVEGFYICENGISRYIKGYAQFYEKNDSMLTYMLAARQGEREPALPHQEKYEQVKQRQEERRVLARGNVDEAEKEEMIREKQNSTKKGYREKLLQEQTKIDGKDSASVKMRSLKRSLTAGFALLCVLGLVIIGNDERMQEMRVAARQFVDGITEQKLPDAMEEDVPEKQQVDVLVAKDKLGDALLAENSARKEDDSEFISQESIEEIGDAGEEEPTPESTEEPLLPEEPKQEEIETIAEPENYTVQQGDTLIGISVKVYGTDSKVEEICQMNQIGNPDEIKEGQKIILP